MGRSAQDDDFSIPERFIVIGDVTEDTITPASVAPCHDPNAYVIRKVDSSWVTFNPDGTLLGYHPSEQSARAYLCAKLSGST